MFRKDLVDGRGIIIQHFLEKSAEIFTKFVRSMVVSLLVKKR